MGSLTSDLTGSAISFFFDEVGLDFGFVVLSMGFERGTAGVMGKVTARGDRGACRAASLLDIASG